MEQTTNWKSSQKRVQGRVQDVKYGLVCCEGCKVEGKVGLIRFVGKVGLQIKCLLELNCVSPVPINSARAFVALGSWLVMEGTK